MRAAGGAVLALLAGACARQEAPRGGPPDERPPVVVAVRPAAFSEAGDPREPIRIEFDDRISERASTGTIEDAVIVSPLTGALRVDHKGDALEVEQAGGLRPGLVYRVMVLPVIRDMFGNVMREPFEFVFSTGAPFHETAVAGLVVDRVTGAPAPALEVSVVAEEEIGAERPVTYRSRTDTAGLYTLRYLPPGEYRLTAWEDRDRDLVADPFEVQATRPVGLAGADTVFLDFPVMQPDTTPAVLARVDVVDSATLRLTFDDYLDPDEALARVGAVLERQREGDPPAPTVQRLLHEHRWDALRSARDSARRAEAARARDTAAVDTSQVADTADVPDTARADPADVRARPGAGARGQPLRGNPLELQLPSQVAYVELADSLPWDVAYELAVEGVVNLAGVPGGGGRTLVVRERPPPPAVPDTGVARPDTGAARPAGPGGRAWDGRPPGR